MINDLSFKTSSQIALEAKEAYDVPELNKRREKSFDMSKEASFATLINSRKDLSQVNLDIQSRNTNSLFRKPYLGPLSIKVFHDESQMKWTQAKLYKEFFDLSLNGLKKEHLEEDPAKKFNHNTGFKRRQLQSKNIYLSYTYYIDQSKLIIEKYAKQVKET